MQTAIITGWGHLDYAFAAAAAWRKYPDATVVGISKRRLPEYLAELGDAGSVPGRVLLLGVSVAGDPDKVPLALAKLVRHAHVHWISAVEWSTDIFGELGPNFQTVMGSQGKPLLELVGDSLATEVRDLSRTLRSEKSGRSGRIRSLVEAAGRRYRRVQDGAAYVEVIRHLAFGSEALPENLERLLDEDRMYGDRELQGDSVAMRQLREAIRKVGRDTDCRVLIVGETGTGKETVAGLLHEYSSRNAEPMICINCADLSPQLLESRLFGHEKGAFTGAVSRKQGAFELADGGTLFLDEVAELSAEAQAGLLRVLEEGRFYRLGGAEEIGVNVRIMAATNRNLPEMVQDGSFREDLFFRVSTVVLRMPPLRERLDDIPAIGNAIWRRLTGQPSLSTGQLADLVTYNWPGNVRELRNILERAHALDESNFGTLIANQQQWLGTPVVEMAGAFPDNLDAMTRLHIRRVLDRNGGNISRAAQALGITRNTVKKYI